MSTQPQPDPDTTRAPVVVPAETAEDLYEHAPCGYLSTLPDGTIIRVNQTLLGWTGFSREELVGRRRFVDLLTAGGRIYHETHYAPLLSMQDRVREIAVDLVCADGRRLPVLVNANLTRTDDGRPRVIRVSVLDATDRRAYERELLLARQRAERSEARARVLAATLQSSLLPPSPPAIPGLEIAAAYRPAGAGDEVGGDFYDVFQTADHAWAVVLGDVSGKGAGAATVTALARHTLRAVALHAGGPAAALRALNTVLGQDATDRFCTVVYLRVVVAPDGEVTATIASGGHALPLHLTAAGVVPVGTVGTLLGILAEPEIHDTTMTLAPGESLFAYTDGVPEGRRGDHFFGEARLVEALGRLQSRPVTDIPDAIVEEVVDFQDGNPRDDIAAVVVGRPRSA